MEKKEFSGEYLAPKVKVVQMRVRQHMMLTGSNFNDSSSDGYTNQDYDWNE